VRYHVSERMSFAVFWLKLSVSSWFRWYCLVMAPNTSCGPMNSAWAVLRVCWGVLLVVGVVGCWCCWLFYVCSVFVVDGF